MPCPSLRVRLCSALFAWIAILVLAGCDGGMSADADVAMIDATDTHLASWNCPDDWVPTAVGGCGPAIVLCMPDGGAAAGACDGVDIHARREITTVDGGIGTPLYRANDGRYAGGWHEEGDPNGYPPNDWTPDAGNGTRGDSWRPDAGIPTCPDGWTRRDDGSCDPVLRTDCPLGSSPLPGGRCTNTAESDCPSTPYVDPGARAIGANIVHVAAGSNVAQADGSELHPFATIAAGVAAAGAGGFVLVSAGRYDDAIVTTGDIHILGTCAAHVTWSPAAPGPAVTAHDASRTVELAGFDFEGPANVLDAAGGSHVVVHDAVITATRGPALTIAESATVVQVDGVAAHDLAPVAPDTGSMFASVRGGARLDITRTSVARAVETGIDVGDMDSVLTMADSAVVNVTAGAMGRETGLGIHDNAAMQLDRVALYSNPGRAITVVTSAQATLRDVSVDRNGTTSASGFPLWVVGARMDAERIGVRDVDGNALEIGNSDVRVADSVITNVRPSIRNLDGSGWGITGIGSRLHIERTWIHDVCNYGALMGTTDPNDRTVLADIDGLVVERIRRASPTGNEIAIAFSGVPNLSARHVLVREARESGIAINGASVGTLSDIVVRDRIGDMELMGFGFLAMEGSRISVRDISVTHVQGVAIASVGENTHLDVDHGFVGHTTVPIIGGFPQGAALALVTGGHATFRHLRVEGAQLFGLILAKDDGFDTGAVLEDSAIIGTTPVFATQVQNVLGGAAGASENTHLEIRRTLVERNSPMAVFSGASAHVEITDSAIRHTITTNRGLSSAGLFAFNDAVLHAERVLVEAAENTGFISYVNATIEWNDGILAGVASDEFGFGTGGNASGDGHLVLDRVAILDTQGAALMATPFMDPTTPRQTGASIIARDLYVRGVGSSPIRVDYDAMDQPVRVSNEASYGIHAGSMCSIDVTRGVLVGAEYGFYASSGTLGMHDGVIASMRDAAGATSAASPVLERVGFVSNARDTIDEHMDLPEGAMLRAPSSSCANPACL